MYFWCWGPLGMWQNGRRNMAVIRSRAKVTGVDEMGLQKVQALLFLVPFSDVAPTLPGLPSVIGWILPGGPALCVAVGILRRMPLWDRSLSSLGAPGGRWKGGASSMGGTGSCRGRSSLAGREGSSRMLASRFSIFSL